MSPLGIQRTIAILILLAPFIFIPSIFKDITFILAGVLLFISTLDLKKKPRHFEDRHEESLVEAPKVA